MQISIQSRGFTLTDALNDYVHKRISFTLTRTASRIRRIDVKLSDINGSRGGIDKRCLIEIRLDGRTNVIVQDIQADMYIAIDRAISRSARTVMRRLALETDRRRTDEALQMHQRSAEI
jgi:ribosomal subunit interface protein